MLRYERMPDEKQKKWSPPSQKPPASQEQEDQPPIATMPLDPDRPMLEQLEEAAASSQDDRDREWLDKNIYQRPDRLSELISTRLAPSAKIKDRRLT